MEYGNVYFVHYEHTCTFVGLKVVWFTRKGFIGINHPNCHFTIVYETRYMPNLFTDLEEFVLGFAVLRCLFILGYILYYVCLFWGIFYTMFVYFGIDEYERTINIFNLHGIILVVRPLFKDLLRANYLYTLGPQCRSWILCCKAKWGIRLLTTWATVDDPDKLLI